ncbi:Lrp/AsnC family transcriptional regulator [Deinococcus deserti]|uniref:Putative transcriptional regulator, AsnC/Lrp family n=1 Tax=Deinococcus deserti (strain DSM 17065 / CIP 109153 / LMG 22923 / VCD115) TaxID=546414 RepID=C1D3D2_DEIDV|nr:Lrp/AsnC family transcriptional regulator [Deinococcus deserti]ACO48011.1 putative transcriptional regulator, AsnC/Lrp family [Deinococcus deserti VCD115]
MDDTDTHLLRLLQHNADTSHAELGRQVGLSATGVHKRLRRLREDGVIKRTAIVLDRAKLGLDLMCFLKVNFKNNLASPNLDELHGAVSALPEVLECYTLTGTNDAIVKVAVRDHVALREFLQRFSEAQSIIERVETCIVLEEIREGNDYAVPKPQ